jgi:hypothetical protein
MEGVICSTGKEILQCVRSGRPFKIRQGVSEFRVPPPPSFNAQIKETEFCLFADVLAGDSSLQLLEIGMSLNNNNWIA